MLRRQTKIVLLSLLELSAPVLLLLVKIYDFEGDPIVWPTVERKIQGFSSPTPTASCRIKGEF